MNETHLRIRELVEDQLGMVVPDADTDLIDSGILDSLGLVSVIVGLEDAFACRLPLDELVIDRFRSVASITSHLEECGVLGRREVG